MKTTINQRLALFLDYMRISQEEYRAVLGVKKQQVSAWLTFKEYIPDKHLIKTIEIYSELNARWLITGEGEMLENTEKINLVKEPNPDYDSPTNRELELTKKLLERTEQLLHEVEKNINNQDTQID